MNRKIVDYLAKTFGIGDEEIAVVYETFLGDFADSVAKLRAAADQPDYSAIRVATHTITGFARNVGADDLGDASVALNASAHAADAEACRRGIEAICDLFVLYGGDLSATGPA